MNSIYFVDTVSQKKYKKMEFNEFEQLLRLRGLQSEIEHYQQRLDCMHGINVDLSAQI